MVFVPPGPEVTHSTAGTGLDSAVALCHSTPAHDADTGSSSLSYVQAHRSVHRPAAYHGKRTTNARYTNLSAM